jgi:hypothetical protein
LVSSLMLPDWRHFHGSHHSIRASLPNNLSTPGSPKTPASRDNPCIPGSLGIRGRQCIQGNRGFQVNPCIRGSQDTRLRPPVSQLLILRSPTIRSPAINLGGSPTIHSRRIPGSHKASQFFRELFLLSQVSQIRSCLVRCPEARLGSQPVSRIKPPV